MLYAFSRDNYKNRPRSTISKPKKHCEASFVPVK